jgi:DNA-directed RNA polymerase sigma subunit (sigma70/sigma32)
MRKLSDEQVKEIRRALLKAHGYHNGTVKLAETYGVSARAIRHIRNRTTHASVSLSISPNDGWTFSPPVT